MYFDNELDRILTEEMEAPFRASVGVVQNGDRWLLGLSTATDDRKGKWCFPGGGIRRGESPERAAVREADEETGVKCRAVGKAFRDPKRKGIAFVHCKASGSKQDLDPNSEFAAVGFFTVREMKSLDLYENVKKIIDKIK